MPVNISHSPNLTFRHSLQSDLWLKEPQYVVRVSFGVPDLFKHFALLEAKKEIPEFEDLEKLSRVKKLASGTLAKWVAETTAARVLSKPSEYQTAPPPGGEDEVHVEVNTDLEGFFHFLQLYLPLSPHLDELWLKELNKLVDITNLGGDMWIFHIDIFDEVINGSDEGEMIQDSLDITIRKEYIRRKRMVALERHTSV
ncbi:hypothetical protein C8J56DRAFT_881919 [Mycena floridula]|nr:hypothetical protein C8J56DRAFT_881919 [Mycena floridula]